jgi:hypothetical protein
LSQYGFAHPGRATHEIEDATSHGGSVPVNPPGLLLGR